MYHFIFGKKIDIKSKLVEHEIEESEWEKNFREDFDYTLNNNEL